MPLLIDGYNLLNVAGVDARDIAGRTELERARRALLYFLASALTDEERAQTTIVFDSKQAPPGLPNELIHADMQILFARGYPAADDLIEELIAANHTPRQLVVVSSDHRLHRAARRRKATALNSDLWITQLEDRRRAAMAIDETPSDEPKLNLAGTNWFAEFGSIDVAEIEAELRSELLKDAADGFNAFDDANPFPPGYGADIDDDSP